MFKPVHIPYPKIKQFRHVIRDVRTARDLVENQDLKDWKRIRLYPTYTFVGTVKLHGTNSSVGYHRASQTFWTQSRNRILNAKNDNAGFHAFCISKKDVFLEMFDIMYAHTAVDKNDIVVFWGEWCGKGIQKDLIINTLDRRFFVFDVAHVSPNHEEKEFQNCKILQWFSYTSLRALNFTKWAIHHIYTIHNYKMFTMDIDFNSPETARERLLEYTQEVCRECPVGHAFDAKGPGEGIVWKCKKYAFKTKGPELTSTRSKTEIGTNPETMKNVHEFIERTITQRRLEQGVDLLFTKQNKVPEKKDVRALMQWIWQDIVKEEGDILEMHQWTHKHIRPHMNHKIRIWFFHQLDFM